MTIPTYRQRLAPAGLMTRRQLRAAGLRPGGHDPVAQLRYWRQGWQLAFLYDARLARPIRPMTPGRRRTLEAMMRARRTCPACRTVRPYCIPRSLGCCPPCHEGEGWVSGLYGPTHRGRAREPAQRIASSITFAPVRRGGA